ncbi:hypothetical protein PVZ87_19290 [Bordetella pertussis]|nr:hypothetical protein PVZ87_19290 [Bordetella pertussis]
MNNWLTLRTRETAVAHRAAEPGGEALSTADDAAGDFLRVERAARLDLLAVDDGITEAGVSRQGSAQAAAGAVDRVEIQAGPLASGRAMHDNRRELDGKRWLLRARGRGQRPVRPGHGWRSKGKSVS